MIDVNVRLTQAAKTVPLILPKNFHRHSMLQEGLSSESDLQNIHRLSTHANTVELKYLYTLIMQNNEIIFTSSSATPEELSEHTDDISYFGDVYEDASPALPKVFKSKRSIFDDSIDKWGGFHSVFLPVESEDGYVYVVGAGIDISKINDQLDINLFNSIKDVILYSLLLIPFFLLYRRDSRKQEKLLELKIAQRTQELQQKDKQMLQQSRLAQMGEMIGMIAHQWRQPLAAISATSADINVKATLGKLEETKAIELSDKILEYSQHLSNTIDDFREFFKPNKERKETSFTELLGSVLGIVETTIQNQNVKIIQDLQCHDTFYSYPNELKQVILNLIKNAEDVLLEKEIRNAYIKIKTYKENDGMVLEVSDNGGGVPDDILDKIFDPYFSTKTAKDGTGLGLYMSKTIIETHCAGSLCASNGIDGAIFKITI